MQRRPFWDVLATGVIIGLVAGCASGLIDAIWSWRPALQYAQGVGRVRFVIYTALSLGTAGAAIGVVVAAVTLGLARGTRIGDLVRFAWQEHETRRRHDPR